jgi:tetratricopeptide (TPR) repeat protein
MKSGKLAEAQEDAQQILRINPNIAEGYYRLGEVFFFAEQYQEAEESFKLGLKIDPNDEKCLEAIRGNIFAHTHANCTELKKNILKAQVRNIVTRGREAFDSGDYVLAINYFDDAIEKNPRNCTYPD